MPKPYPAEFRQDVIAIARKREASLPPIPNTQPFGSGRHALHS